MTKVTRLLSAIILVSSSLAIASEPSLSGVWQDLSTGSQFEVVEDEERLYVIYQSEGTFQSADSAKQVDGTYKGKIVTTTVFSWNEWTPFGNATRPQQKQCSIEGLFEILRLSPSRIEGRVKTPALPPPGGGRQVKFYKSCGESTRKDAVWKEFVIIRK